MTEKCDRSKLPGCTSVDLLVAGKGPARKLPLMQTGALRAETLGKAGCGEVAKAGASTQGISKVAALITKLVKIALADLKTLAATHRSWLQNQTSWSTPSRMCSQSCTLPALGIRSNSRRSRQIPVIQVKARTSFEIFEEYIVRAPPPAADPGDKARDRRRRQSYRNGSSS